MRRAYWADQVRSAEEPLLAAGKPLMEQAAYAVAGRVIAHLQATGLRVSGATVLALAGKGNNGGDALYAAVYLAQRGLSVRAAHLPGAHPDGIAAAQRAGVRCYPLTGDTAGAGASTDLAVLRELAFWGGTWLDGLLGLGSTGAAREPIASWITMLNTELDMSPAEPFVLAIDLPSGLTADSGKILGPVLRAHETLATGSLKPAHLLAPARFQCGEVTTVDLGFAEFFPASPAVAELTAADVADRWRIPSKTDHKYTRGVVGMLTGSRTYPGAALLGVGGALASGVGMVRYLGESPLVLPVYPEVVPAPGQVQSWILGSGVEETQMEQLRRTLTEAVDQGLPIVLDAGAISLAYTGQFPETVILTPHPGELVALLTARGIEISRPEVEADPHHAAKLAAEITGATVLLTAATDVCATPSGICFSQGGAPGWRATAGAGDVLAGLLGGMLAGVSAEFTAGLPAQYAAAAAYVHASAAAIASDRRMYGCCELSGVDCATRPRRIGHPITASDIVKALPIAIDRILNLE
ncbi:MAG: NAD(P)H-hydrate epimerase [Trueperella sp.]|nr:NAD(P)H-hydrate epimerase [Trueperella sp.]